MRIGHRPPNPALQRIGQMLYVRPPKTYFRQYGVGGVRNSGPPHSIGRRIDCVRQIDILRSPPTRPIGFRGEKMGRTNAAAPEFNDVQSPISKLFLNGRWHREEAKVTAKRPDWHRSKNHMYRATWIYRHRISAFRPHRLRAGWPK